MATSHCELNKLHVAKVNWQNNYGTFADPLDASFFFFSEGVGREECDKSWIVYNVEWTEDELIIKVMVHDSWQKYWAEMAKKTHGFCWKTFGRTEKMESTA